VNDEFSRATLERRLKRLVGRSRYAAVKNLKMVYNSQRCPIPGTTKTKGGIYHEKS